MHQFFRDLTFQTYLQILFNQFSIYIIVTKKKSLKRFKNIFQLQIIKKTPVPMLEDKLPKKPLKCPLHKSQKITHICTQLYCQNNPLLCAKCFNESLHLYHSAHEKKLLPVQESVEKLASTIRTHVGPMKKVFKSTLGKSEYAGIYEHVMKGEHLQEELDQRIKSIKDQVELQLDLLMKQFQKTLLLEKQEYFKILDSYQRTFKHNIDLVREQTQPLMAYQHTMKYYSNENNLFLKVGLESRKKTDWLIKSKKIISQANKILESSTYMSDVIGMLNSANKIRLDLLPTWKGEENMDKGSQLKYLIKRALNQWVYLPEIKNLGEESENGRGHQLLHAYR